MIRLFFKIDILLFFLPALLCSCVSFKVVSDFSASALEGVVKFDEIGYSFKQNCLDDCYYSSISNLSIDQQVCDCSANEKADSVNRVIYLAVKGYLNGLKKLSDNQLANYKTDALAGSLSAFRYGSITLEKGQVEAYSKISEILLRAITDNYRAHKLKDYLKSGNEPFGILIDFLCFNLTENLNGKLNVQKQTLRGTYFDLTKDNTLSTWDKRKAIEEYVQLTRKIDLKRKEIQIFSTALKKTALGHKALVDNLDNLDSDQIRELVGRYSSDIKGVISEYYRLVKE